jgi:cytochrome c551
MKAASNRIFPCLLSLIILSLLWLCGCESKPAKQSSIKFRQYYLQGQELYSLHCSNCHQQDGSGLRLIYPPLDTSDYMNNNFRDVLCLIKKGKEGEIVVNGKKFNQRMPSFTHLSDLEIAEISTYIYNTWSHQKGLIEVKQVSETLSTCQ